MQDKLITIFGGGGFLGTYISQRLLKAGARVRIAERNPRNALHIKPLGNLGQTQFASADIRKKDTVLRAVQGSDIVINLVGILKGNFHAFHVAGARNVAKAAADAGCDAMIHISAIGADTQSESAYGRSKGEGEAAVLDAFPKATILRPSIVFGREDDFINRFAKMIKMLPIVPVIGGDTKFQPVFVDDVAKAVIEALANPAQYAGKTLELGGPEVISMEQLNRRIAEASRRTRGFIPVPDFVSGIMASATGWLPGAPITKDQWTMLQSDNVVANGKNGLKTMGIVPTPLGAVMDEWMVRYREHGRFGSRVEQR